MPPHDLMNIAQRKIRHASTLAGSFSREVREWEGRNVQISVEPDRENNALVFRMVRLPQLPDHWADSVADIMQNARNCLDHIAFALTHVANKYQQLDESDARKIQFPWSKSEDAFKDLTKKVGKYFRAEDWGRLEELQIHNSVSTSIWGQAHHMPFPHGVPLHLGVLFQIANMDKHREPLPLTIGVVEKSGPPDMVEGIRVSTAVVHDMLVEGEIFARWQLDGEMPSRFNFDLVRRHLPISLTLPYGYFSWPEALDMFGFPVRDLRDILQGCLKAVETVLYIFEPALTRGDPPRSVPSAATDQGWF